MSLRGRYVIDSMKRFLGGYVKLPAPPMADSGYWEGAYRSLGPEDIFEWANLSCTDLLKYQYREVHFDSLDPIKTDQPTEPCRETSLGHTLGVHPYASKDEPILLVGCGNSRFGEDMMEAGWRGPIIHTDISARVIESMSQRCSKYQTKGDMQFIQDDATVLSAFHGSKIAATIDKGLLDALFCVDEYEQCYDVMKAVHRVLIPGGIFVALSFSRPQFILEKLVFSPTRAHNHVARSMWEDIQIQQLGNIMLYRFTKAEDSMNKPASKLKL